MPAKSKAQQKLMGMAYAYKKGETKDASPQVKKLAKNMSLQDLKDFAETDRDDLPEKTDESVNTPPNRVDPIQGANPSSGSEGPVRPVDKQKNHVAGFNTFEDRLQEKLDGLISEKKWMQKAVPEENEGKFTEY